MDVSWEPDGTILIAWLDDDAIRCEGAVAIRQTVRVEPTTQYADRIEKVRAAALAVVSDALEDWRGSEVAPDPQRALAEQITESVLQQANLEEDDDSTLERNWQAIQQAQTPGMDDYGRPL